VTRAGRYDSTERHSKKCAGFKELFSEIPVAPVEVTNGEFEAVKEYRNSMKPGQSDDAPPLVEAAIAKVLTMLIESAGGDLWYLLSLPNLAPQFRTIIAHLAEQWSPSSPLGTASTSSLSEPDEFLLLEPEYQD
jgi:hypothetical protein